jgi:hypothetical protein
MMPICLPRNSNTICGNYCMDDWTLPLYKDFAPAQVTHTNTSPECSSITSRGSEEGDQIKDGEAAAHRVFPHNVGGGFHDHMCFAHRHRTWRYSTTILCLSIYICMHMPFLWFYYMGVVILHVSHAMMQDQARLLVAYHMLNLLQGLLRRIKLHKHPTLAVSSLTLLIAVGPPSANHRQVFLCNNCGNIRNSMYTYVLCPYNSTSIGNG